MTWLSLNINLVKESSTMYLLLYCCNVGNYFEVHLVLAG